MFSVLSPADGVGRRSILNPQTRGVVSEWRQPQRNHQMYSSRGVSRRVAVMRRVIAVFPARLSPKDNVSAARGKVRPGSVIVSSLRKLLTPREKRRDGTPDALQLAGGARGQFNQAESARI